MSSVSIRLLHSQWPQIFDDDRDVNITIQISIAISDVPPLGWPGPNKFFQNSKTVKPWDMRHAYWMEINEDR